MDTAIESYKKMGYSVNDSVPMKLEINNISVQTASTILNDKYEFSTQWGFIGQGETMVSPCMLMMWQSAIANGTGKATLPYLIHHTTDVTGSEDIHAAVKYTSELFKPETAEYVKQIMLNNGQRYSGSIYGYTVAVKSGTAQVKNGDEENSFLTGFNADESNPIAFCVLIEDRKPGEVTTEEIAGTILSSLS